MAEPLRDTLLAMGGTVDFSGMALPHAPCAGKPCSYAGAVAAHGRALRHYLHVVGRYNITGQRHLTTALHLAILELEIATRALLATPVTQKQPRRKKPKRVETDKVRYQRSANAKYHPMYHRNLSLYEVKSA
jgi:hypothetical protein